MTWQVSSDAEYCEWLAGALRVDVAAPSTDGLGRFERSCAVYDEAAVVVSNRLHVLLIAASRGAKPVSILHSQERKVRAIMTDSGLSHQNIEIGISSNRQIEYLVAAEWQRSTYRALVLENAGRLTTYFDRTLGSCLPD